MAISKKLNEREIETRCGTEWTGTAVSTVLKNRTYTDNLLLQKTYRPDYVSKKSLPNNGEADKYLVEQTHEPIIDEFMYLNVQAEMERRAKPVNAKTTRNVPHAFTGKIECGICGAKFKRKKCHERYVWSCTTYELEGKSSCPAKRIPEQTLYDIISMHGNVEDLKKIITLPNNNITLIFNDGRAICEQEYNTEIQKLRDEISLLAEQAKMCISEKATTAQSQADYERKYSAISSRYEQAEQRLKKLMNETEQRHVRKTRLIAFINDLGEQAFVLGEWSEEAWVKMVESVTVERTGRMVFLFKDGSEGVIAV